MMDRFMRLLDDLHQKVSLMPAFRWAVVESVSPLRIRYETEAAPVAGTPDTIVAGLQVGDRVWCMRIHRRDIVLGRGKGDHDTGWVDLSSYITSTWRNVCIGRRRGGVIEILFDGGAGSVPTGNTVIGSLPADWSPQRSPSRSGAAFFSGSYTGTAIYTNSGSLSISHQSGAARSNCRFSLTFMEE